jgi:hypothetical protein
MPRALAMAMSDRPTPDRVLDDPVARLEIGRFVEE